MRMNLETRLAALERKEAPAAGPRVLILCGINPGYADSPRVRAEFYGQTLHRLDDETEEAFTARAAEAARAAAGPGRMAQLSMYGAEPPMQWHCEGGVLVARPIAEGRQ